MKDFLMELKLAIEDYFCGEFTLLDYGISVKLNDGKTFYIAIMPIN